MKEETIFTLSYERTRLVWQAIIHPNKRRTLKREIDKLTEAIAKKEAVKK